MKKTLIFLFCITIFSCQSIEMDSDDCIDNLLNELEMDHYEGNTETGCITYLRWHTHQDKNFFTYINACEDHIQHLLDCDNNDLYKDNYDFAKNISSEMIFQKIVGREK